MFLFGHASNLFDRSNPLSPPLGGAGEGGGEGSSGQLDSTPGQTEITDWTPNLIDCPKDPHTAKFPVRDDQPLYLRRSVLDGIFY